VVVVVVMVVVAVVVVETIVDEDPLGEGTDEGELPGGAGSGQVSSKTFSLAAWIVYSL
jgi:hypothetical protein